MECLVSRCHVPPVNEECRVSRSAISIEWDLSSRCDVFDNLDVVCGCVHHVEQRPRGRVLLRVHFRRPLGLLAAAELPNRRGRRVRGQSRKGTSSLSRNPKTHQTEPTAYSRRALDTAKSASLLRDATARLVEEGCSCRASGTDREMG